MSNLIKFLDADRREIYINADEVFSVSESSRPSECFLRTKNQTDSILVLCSLETAVARINSATDYKAKYEKCLNVIRRFDPGIIGMYDL